MPSPKGYKRDYQQEEKTATARGENADNALRHRARRLEVKKGLVKPGDGKDVDHKQALSKGGSGVAPSNLRIESAHDNRSFPRSKTGAMIANHPKKK